jgi:hypothetical protein
MGHGRYDIGDLREGTEDGGRVSSKSEREREGGDEGDVGDSNKARWGRKMKARATHPDERGQACVHGERHRVGASVPAFSRPQTTQFYPR